MKIDRDTLDLFAYQVAEHGIISATVIAEDRYGDAVAHALLDEWYACRYDVVQSDRNVAARADAQRRRAAGF